MRMQEYNMKNNNNNSIVTGLIALTVLVVSVLSMTVPTPSVASVSDVTIGKPGGTVAVTTCTSVTNVVHQDELAHLSAGHVNTDELGTGVVGETSLSVGVTTATSIGALTAGTKQIEIIPSVAINYGGAGVATGTGLAVLAANSRTVWKVSTTTPVLYFIGQTTTGTVNVIHVK
jgi:hypothetical protein